MDEKKKQWCCKNGHILGFIHLDGHKIPQLMVLRKAINLDVRKPNKVDLLGTVYGQMAIRCSTCDDVRSWDVSVETLVALFMQLDDKTVFEFSRMLLEKNLEVHDG